jgi:mannitol/fructose-specific phosphotransferase system IIA component
MEILKNDNIILNAAKEGPEDAIRRCGRLLADGGYVNERYIEGMLARDKAASCAIGNFIAIPHGEIDYKKDINATGLVLITYPQAIDWNGVPVHIVIGIAAKGEEHNDILGNIVDIFEDEEDIQNFLRLTDKAEILRMLTGDGA